jgi:alanine racemase
MVGTIISSAGVTFSTADNKTQTVLEGRALSLVGSVTMVNTTINVPQ